MFQDLRIPFSQRNTLLALLRYDGLIQSQSIQSDVYSNCICLYFFISESVMLEGRQGQMFKE